MRLQEVGGGMGPEGRKKEEEQTLHWMPQAQETASGRWIPIKIGFENQRCLISLVFTMSGAQHQELQDHKAWLWKDWRLVVPT